MLDTSFSIGSVIKFLLEGNIRGWEAMTLAENKKLSLKQKAYRKVFRDCLKKHGINNLAKLSKEDSKKFFQDVKNTWKNSKPQTNKESVRIGQTLNDLHTKSYTKRH